MARQPSRILDEYLVISAKGGDRDAFAVLVRRWQKKLIAHAWRLTGDREVARDAVQTGWNEIVRGLGSLQDERAFPAWAYRIVSRACAKQVKHKMQQGNISMLLMNEPAMYQPDTDAKIDGQRLRIAVRALPPEQRAAVALFYFEEMGVGEVAVALDVPTGTVKTRLMHARRKLRAAMEGEI